MSLTSSINLWKFEKISILITVYFVFGQKFEKKYNNELVKGAVSKETRFEYAWCLIRSKYTEDIKKGIVLLEGQLIITFRIIRLRSN